MVRYGGTPGPCRADPSPGRSIIRSSWLTEPGPGGGGGGGGNKMQEPARKAELPGKDKITVPVVKLPQFEPPQQTKVEPNFG